jgi:ADP-heptose:LPS heptosyltransferase
MINSIYSPLKLGIIMPESAGDVFLCTALLKNLRETYPEYEIYFVTKPQYQCILKGNPYIDFVIDYYPEMDNVLLLEGVDTHKGVFDICLAPHLQTQRLASYLHNGLDRIAFNLRY